MVDLTTVTFRPIHPDIATLAKMNSTLKLTNQQLVIGLVVASAIAIVAVGIIIKHNQSPQQVNPKS